MRVCVLMHILCTVKRSRIQSKTKTNHCSRSSIFRVSTSPGWRCSTLDAGLDDGLSPSSGPQRTKK
ncbi:BQ5605_C026g10242 [Microbotryum silenes-dioicae]|uniref:BQ5605_C026g10242 protein n=1 Tax=Microbotryum silenes-dioicae TaxID=796604 RepID=A0A2X0PN28_9BASI|nr:BQ5605_C026g10242 [Microbotryum silenes-dioicae]